MISKDKQYRTRDGREVRIYATDGFGGWAIHGAIKLFESTWKPMTWQPNGTQNAWEKRDDDLIEVKPRIKREYWVNVYDASVYDYRLFPTKEVADDNLEDHTHRIACVKVVIDCEEGEGL